MRRARPWAMFQVRANSQPSRRATPAIAALRFPIQSRGASFQTASCASTVITRNSLEVFSKRLLIDCSIMFTMTKRQSFEPIGAVLRRIAGKLAAERNRKAAPRVGNETASFPAGIKKPTGVGGEVGAPAQGGGESGAPGRTAAGRCTVLPFHKFGIAKVVTPHYDRSVDGPIISTPLHVGPSFVSLSKWAIVASAAARSSGDSAIQPGALA